MNAVAFRLLGRVLKAGHTVDIHDTHAVFNQVHTDDAYGTNRMARSALAEQYADTPVGIWLATRPHYLSVKRVTKWPSANIMDWYQSPYYHFVISSIHFQSDADAIQFKLTWL